ncbi:DUF1365 domain-containing protein [Kribbella antibiotica]|uniref:DUF1365 domain-containing protein n=1 Tax=Kribbella antibiotica TaxID=190195 RepID=UPI001EDFE950|nr:DUF1365 domain-containing protein [Kribbella antibiotica]
MNGLSLPAIVPGWVAHTRQLPRRHRFRYRTYQWLVDIDDLPAFRPLASFRPADHLNGGERSLRENLTSFIAGQNEVLEPDDQVLMLANARSFGYVFDPLSVFWCFAPDGSLRWVVLEVHNTYGERHSYLAHPTADGRFTVEKAFYVSPFFTVDGTYEVVLDLTPDRVAVAINLHQQGARAFSAAFTGRPRAATRRTRLAVAARTPFVTYQVSLLIRLHGIALWLRRLPVVHRPPHTPLQGA